MTTSDAPLPIPRVCSKSRCKSKLPPEDEYEFKTCERCRAWARKSKAKVAEAEAVRKRKREGAEDDINESEDERVTLNITVSFANIGSPYDADNSFNLDVRTL